MQQDPKPSPLETLSHRVFATLPASLRTKTDHLTQTQKINIMLATAGSIGFFLLWLVFTILFNNPVSDLDERAFSRSRTTPNTPTAITSETSIFPQHQEPVPAQIHSGANADADVIKPVIALTPLQQEEIKRLRDNVTNEYQTALSFPLTESRMIVFAQVATRIDRINARWDTLIAGAETDALAIEYLSSAQMEIQRLLNNTPNMSKKDYNEIYNLASRDNKFNMIANAYKALVALGIWGPITPVQIEQDTQSQKKASQNLLFPVAPQTPSHKNIKQPDSNPVAAPDDSETPPAPTH